MRTWSRKPLGLPLTDIAECADGSVTFKVLGGGAGIPAAKALEPDSISDDMFIARWEAEEGMQYLLTVYDIDDETDCAPSAGIRQRQHRLRRPLRGGRAGDRASIFLLRKGHARP